MKYFVGFVGWIISVAIAQCAVALWVVWSGCRLDGGTTWAIVLPVSMALWPFVHRLIRPVCNRYRFHKRMMRWLERQFPLLPLG